MFFDIITYLPMYTALFWAIMLLISKDKGESAKTLLGLVMVSIFILDLSMMFFYHHENKLYLYFDPVNTFFTISSFLLLYWYIKLLTKERKIEAKNLWLLTPGFILALISTSLYLLMSPEERTNYIDNFLFRYGEFTNITLLIKLKVIEFYISKGAFVIIVIYSIIKCQILIKKYNNRISNYYSNLSNISIDWMQKIIYGLIVAGFVSIIVNSISQPFLLNANIAVTLAAIFFSALIYVVGYLGYRQDYNISNIETIEDNAQEDSSILIKKNTVEFQRLAGKIVHLFEQDKIHRKQDLKISDLSFKLNSNRSYISKIINTQFDCTFIEFVNKHRIADAKMLFLEQPESSISDISHQAGFNSASTFTRVFKQHVGESPSIYRTKLQKENS